MDFMQAVAAMRQGKRIRRKTWIPRSSWRLLDNELVNNNGIEVAGWEVVEDKTLSEKELHWDEAYRDSLRVMKTEDVKEHLKEFIKDWIWLDNALVQKRAEEIFGKELMEE